MWKAAKLKGSEMLNNLVSVLIYSDIEHINLDDDWAMAPPANGGLI